MACATNATVNGCGAAVDNDMVGDGMQCSDHSYRNNASGGGICASCLQEKLGKLVSSSSTSFFIGSSSPSFRSDFSDAGGGGGFISNAASLALRPAVVVSSSSSSNGHCHQDTRYCSTTKTAHYRRVHVPFFLTQKKKKKKKAIAEHHRHQQHHSSLMLKRSKSTATSRRRGGNPYLSSDNGEDYYKTHQKRGGFWSFYYPFKQKSEKPSATTGDLKPASSAPVLAASSSVELVTERSSSSLSSSKTNGVAPIGPEASSALESKRAENVLVVDENSDSPNSSISNTTSFGKKVSRSRSLGCGNRSFSGDLFELISTGFGDCTLRRLKSQREPKRSSTSAVTGDVIKDRIRCSRIFSSFMITSSSSSSCSSSYRLSSSTAAEEANGKTSASMGTTIAAVTAVHGGSRSRGWGWALASPMRVFGKPPPPSSSSSASKTNPAPNFAAFNPPL